MDSVRVAGRFPAVVAAGILLGWIHLARAQDPIPAGPDAPTQFAYAKELMRYRLRLVDEYAKRTKDPAELRDAAKQLLSATKRTELGVSAELSREQVQRLSADLVARGSTDPLIVAIAMLTTKDLTNKKQIKEQLERAIAEALVRYEPQQQIEVIRWCQIKQLQLYNTFRRERDVFRAPDSNVLADAYLRWFVANRDDLASQRHMWMILTSQYLASRPFYSKEFVELARRSTGKKVHPWMRHMLDAQAARFAGNDVKQKEDGSSDPFYKEAARHYQTAWKLAPQFPEAATELIQLSRFGHVEGTPRQWFDRVVAVEMDHPMAYTIYRTHLRTEGVDALVGFGGECAATRRYDTRVPFELLECLWAIENETGENIWAAAGIYEQVRDLCQDALKSPRYLDGPQTKQTLGWLAASQIVIAARAARFEEIGPLWAKTDESNLHRAAQMYGWKSSLAALKASADAAAEGTAKLVNEVEKALASLPDAKAVEQAERKVEPIAQALKNGDSRVALWQATIAFYRNFYGGKWADVVFPPGCTQLADAPKWTRAGDRALVTRGTYRYRLPYLASLPEPYELRYELSAVQLPPDVQFAGVLLGSEHPVANRGTRSELFVLDPPKNKASIYSEGHSDYDVPCRDVNQIHLRVWHGHREYFVNGERMTAYSTSSDRPNGGFDPSGSITLWAPGAEDSSPIVRFGNLQIRAIPFESPPPYSEHAARVAYFTERIEASPKFPWNYLDRGNAYLSLGQAAQAIADFEHLLKQRSEWDNARFALGRAKAANGEYAAAVELYQQLLKKDPRATNVLNRLAWLEATCPEAKFRNGKQALERVKLALDASRNRRRGYFLTQAAAYAELGDFPAAQAALKRAEPLSSVEDRALLEPMKMALDAKRPFRSDTPQPKPEP